MAIDFTVIGNWKMHGSKQQVSEFFAELIKKTSKETNEFGCEVVVCPPNVFLDQAAKLIAPIKGVYLGAQDVSKYPVGAYTGQVSADMLKEQGCRYVIVGHSERRLYNGETDIEIANKFFAAKEAGLTPILCVGETLAQREQQATEKVVLSQMAYILENQGIEAFQDAIIAYEPVWAIGTGLTATPEQAEAVHLLLRQTLAKYDSALAQTIPLIYGGSVKASNAKALFTMPNINGALVGGASLQMVDFWGICEAADSLAQQG